MSTNEIEAIQVLRLGPGDVLWVQAKSDIPGSVAADLENYLKLRVRGHEVVITTPSIKLGVIRRGQP